MAEPYLTQAAIISVQGLPGAPSLVTQSAAIVVTANNRGYISLGPPIPLDCWQPCTSYGTNAIVVILGE